jgi:hypothetical protein
MSDRTPGSVRSASPTGDTAAPKDGPQGAAAPVSATQSIPGTGTQRAQAAAAQGVPAGMTGRTATAAPVTGATAVVGTATGTPTGAATATGTPSGAAGATGAGTAIRTGSGTGTGTPTGSAGGAPARPADRPADRSTPRTPRGPAKSGRGPRRARLQLRHIDTWSALKISLVLSIALFFIWMVAIGILYMVLNGLGVFQTLNDLFGQVGSVSDNKPTSDVITPGVVFGGAAVIGAINIVLMTALCTVATFIYNLCSDLVGGLEITLSERD